MIDFSSNIANPIKILESEINNATIKLPEHIFLFISKITPLVNTDLMIKDETGRILLSWRQDKYTEVGWHFPGRILRFKNSLRQCIYDLIDEEIKRKVVLNEVPIEYNEIIEDHPKIRDIRSHFISFLFRKKITPPAVSTQGAGPLRWPLLFLVESKI